MNLENAVQLQRDAERRGGTAAGTAVGVIRVGKARTGTPSVFIRLHPWLPVFPAILTRGSR